MSNSLRLSQLLQHNLPKAQPWAGGSGQCGLPGTQQSAVTEDDFSVTDCSPLHFCSLLLVALVFQTFKIANLGHIGFFFFLSLLKQFCRFFLKKKVSSSDFIAALLKQYTKNKKRESIQISGFFQTSGLFIVLKNTLFSPPMKTAVYSLLTKYRCKVTEFHITNKFK